MGWKIRYLYESQYLYKRKSTKKEYFSEKEERRTRRHGITLAKKQCRQDIRKFSFSQRTVNECNRLLADCIGASGVNMFKNKIDKYLRRAEYI